jgi:hypothetical protein
MGRRPPISFSSTSSSSFSSTATLGCALSIHLHERNSIAGAQNFVLRAQLTTLNKNAVCRRSNSVKRPKLGEVTLL